MSKSANSNLYNFLSIGQRGVGKTVFLTACYLECHQDQAQQRLLWFDCEDKQVRQIIDDILIYVSKTGNYPPATLKITNFEFNLKQRNQQGSKTIGKVKWLDTPGEICNIHNISFTTMIANADGCCLFLDVPNLVESADCASALNQLLQPLETVIEFMNDKNLDLPLALILNKCDRLADHPLHWQRLKKALSPLITKLQKLETNYQFFYSEIPIVVVDGVSKLQLTRVGTPIYWLFSEIHRSRSPLSSDQSEKSNYYIPTPPPRFLTSLLGINPQLDLLNQIPKKRLLIGLMIFMGLISLGSALILQQTFDINSSPSSKSSDKSLSR